MTIQEYITQYGTRGTENAVSMFIQKAPGFRGDVALAKLLGVMMADLRSALEACKL